MTYIELLQSVEWVKKRNEIINRDENKCQSCFNQKYLEKTILPFNVRPHADKSILLLGEAPFEIIVDKKKSYFSDLKKKSKESILIILDTLDGKIQVLGNCVLNISFTNDDLMREHENLINKQLEKYDTARKDAIKKYLMDTTLKNNLELKKSFFYRYLRENIDNENSIRWFNIKNLHVHHKYYQIGKLPWEYPNEALVTLCWDCHETLHKNLHIPLINELGLRIGKLRPCSRCFGAGSFPEFSHIQNGICFRCYGAKYDEYITYSSNH